MEYEANTLEASKPALRANIENGIEFETSITRIPYEENKGK